MIGVTKDEESTPDGRGDERNGLEKIVDYITGVGTDHESAKIEDLTRRHCTKGQAIADMNYDGSIALKARNDGLKEMAHFLYTGPEETTKRLATRSSMQVVK